MSARLLRALHHSAPYASRASQTVYHVTARPSPTPKQSMPTLRKVHCHQHPAMELFKTIRIEDSHIAYRTLRHHASSG